MAKRACSRIWRALHESVNFVHDPENNTSPYRSLTGPVGYRPVLASAKPRVMPSQSIVFTCMMYDRLGIPTILEVLFRGITVGLALAMLGSYYIVDLAS